MVRPDVIIPVYKPDSRFEKVIGMLLQQTVRPAKLILMNTQAEGFLAEDIARRVDRSARKYDRAARLSVQVEIVCVKKEDYDHGGTRNLAVRRYSDAEYFVCMTQDAVPADGFLLERLLKCFDDPRVGAAYARQMAEEGADFTEIFLRLHNYPAQSVTKTKEDLERLGIKTFMISNACAMYRRDRYDSLSGFVTDTIFNEDMIYGAKLIEAGDAIRYCADAHVYHTHHYNLKAQFQRSFDLAVSQADYPEVFQSVSSEREGIRLVKGAADFCLSQKRYGDLARHLAASTARYAGFFLGKHYRLLPEGIVKRCTLQPAYWEKKKRRQKAQGRSGKTEKCAKDCVEITKQQGTGEEDAEAAREETLGRLHELELSALKAFLALCHKYGLRYYAIGGTLLGAVRHKGFIPWDDDVDVAMPRPDYDRLIELVNSGEAAETLGEDFVIESWQTNPEFKSYFAKVASAKYEIWESLLEDTTKRKGYLIDILPIDGTPDDETRRKVYYAKAMFYRFLCGTANVNTGIRTSRPVWEQMVLRVVRFFGLYRLIRVKDVYRKMDRLFWRQDAEHAKYAGTLLGAYKTKEIVPREFFGETYEEYSEWAFEDIMVRGPKEWESYLLHMFGNYNELPPKDKRKIHYRPEILEVSSGAKAPDKENEALETELPEGEKEADL